MEVSVIIPTYNREKDLEEALMSILIQTKLPKEVIIVDDSDNDCTKELLNQLNKKFEEKSVLLHYVKKMKAKSISISKNIGVKHSKSDVILFLDDDVVLEKDYIFELLKVYQDEPLALGVQGYIISETINSFSLRLDNLLRRLFFLFHKEENSCRVLRSGHNTYPLRLPRQIIKCHWLSGVASYKKSVFDDIGFDENLKLYSLGEDKDTSYRLYKNHSGSLYLTPRAKLFHKSSPVSRMPHVGSTFMETVYYFYLFYKNIDQTFFNNLVFIWSNCGNLIYTAGVSIKKKELYVIPDLIRSYVWALRHLPDLKKGNLKKFNYCLKKMCF